MTIHRTYDNWKTTEPDQFDCDGLTEEDRIAIAMDEASEIRAGKLVNGICKNCDANYQQVIGARWCGFCREGY